MVEIFGKRPPALKPEKTCNITDCPNPPAWQAGIRLWAKGKRGAPIQMEIGLFICEEHKKSIRFSDLVSDEGWKQICGVLRRIGKEEPDRSLTELWMIPILSL